MQEVTRGQEGYTLLEYDEGQLSQQLYSYLHYGAYDRPSGVNGLTIPYWEYRYCALSDSPEFGGEDIAQYLDRISSSTLLRSAESSPSKIGSILWLDVQRIDPRKTAGS